MKAVHALHSSVSESARPARRQTVRLDVVTAIAALNERNGVIGWHTPAEIADHLHAVRNTLSTTLGRMTHLGMLERKIVPNAGAVKGTVGYQYALLGTPQPDGAPYDAERARELVADTTREVNTFLDNHAPRQAATGRQSRRRVLTPGRVTRTFTVDQDNWAQVEAMTRGEGVPQRAVLDHVLDYYIQTHAGRTPNPHARVLHHFPAVSGPRPRQVAQG
jgi:hypothetical protein